MQKIQNHYDEIYRIFMTMVIMNFKDQQNYKSIFIIEFININKINNK